MNDVTTISLDDIKKKDKPKVMGTREADEYIAAVDDVLGIDAEDYRLVGTRSKHAAHNRRLFGRLTESTVADITEAVALGTLVGNAYLSRGQR